MLPEMLGTKRSSVAEKLWAVRDIPQHLMHSLF